MLRHAACAVVSTALTLLSGASAFVVPGMAKAVAPARPHASPLMMSTAETETAQTQYMLDKKKIGGPITPISNSILVKVRSVDATSGGGIILPEKSQTKPTEGVVVSMGPGRTHSETGVLVDLPCAVGDKVLYGEYDGTAVDYMGADHQFVRDQDILFVYSGERMEPDTIKMIRDELLVKLDPESTTTKSGLLLGTKEENTGTGPTTGEVVATGPGRSSSDGKIVPMSVAKGDFVKFRAFAGSEVSLQGVDYRVMKADEVLAKY
ncbi:unnamed protein product [Pylaiella littoralis]